MPLLRIAQTALHLHALPCLNCALPIYTLLCTLLYASNSPVNSPKGFVKGKRLLCCVCPTPTSPELFSKSNGSKGSFSTYLTQNLSGFLMHKQPNLMRNMYFSGLFCFSFTTKTTELPRFRVFYAYFTQHQTQLSKSKKCLHSGLEKVIPAWVARLSIPASLSRLNNRQG